MRVLAGLISVCWVLGHSGGAPNAAAQSPAASESSVVLSAPMSVDRPSQVPRARDVAYPGVMTLHVDVTDLDRKIWRIRQSIPLAHTGRVALYYPQWIPGNHAPRGPIYNYAGLRITANGVPVRWERDPGDVFLFWVDAPNGAKSIEIEAQFLQPTEPAHGGAQVTREMLRLNWYALALYPAGYYARRIDVDASITLPPSWEAATALTKTDREGDTIHYKRESFETLVDSPLFAGAHFSQIDLDPGGRSPVRLNVFGDTPAMIQPSDAALAAHRTLVQQADRLFGSRQFDHYDFLLAVSDRLAGSGIEHHRSSDNGVRGGYLSSWDRTLISRDLLAHEYVHSWNGKYRRPAELWTPHYNTPMRDSLLWVYEGLTQYYGWVLATRSGFYTPQQALDSLALTAAAYENRVGRQWRPLVDTTHDPIIAARRALPWRSWQRSEDYYSEGLLIWLEVDTLIRELSRERSSLDTFARSFFGGKEGDRGQSLYTRDDLISALNRIQPYDWAGFFKKRVDDVAPGAPLEGLNRGGYRLDYSDAPNSVQSNGEGRLGGGDYSYSVGFAVDRNGRLTSVQWEGPAFQVGLTDGVQIVAVNGLAFDADRLRDAIAATSDPNTPVSVMYKDGDVYRTVELPYAGGLRFPKLTPLDTRLKRLDAILAPR